MNKKGYLISRKDEHKGIFYRIIDRKFAQNVHTDKYEEIKTLKKKGFKVINNGV